MLTILTGLLITVLMVFLFGLTIFVHEFGHFLAARKLGLVVDVFSIGFGPSIWKRRLKGGLLLKVGWIPLGGYVALPQLDPTAMAPIQHGADGGDAPRVLPAVSAWRKIIVALAGAVGNLVLALILAQIIAVNPGATRTGDDARIGAVATNSPAYAAGLRPGHIIVAVNGQRVRTWEEFQIEAHLADDAKLLELEVTFGDDRTAPAPIRVPVTHLSEDPADPTALRGVDGVVGRMHCVVLDITPGSAAAIAGIQTNDVIHRVNRVPVLSVQDFIEQIGEHGADRTVELEILRRGTFVNVAVTPAWDAETQRPLIGVTLADMAQHRPMWMQYRNPWKQISYDARGIFRLLRSFVAPTTKGEAGRAAESLGGPIMIMVTLWLSVRYSLLAGIGFVRFLNVNLAILNLLPIPVLDGGHILFSLWESITRRKPNPRVVNVLIHIFVVLFLAAALLISRNDVRRLWRSFRVQSTVVAVAEDDTDPNAATTDIEGNPTP